MKVTGVSVICFACLIPVIIFGFIDSTSLQAVCDTYSPSITTNVSAVCDYTIQYDLQDDIRLTVCKLETVFLIDIRKFVNDTATIKGIQLRSQQWIRLKRFIPYVDSTISN